MDYQNYLFLTFWKSYRLSKGKNVVPIEFSIIFYSEKEGLKTTYLMEKG